MLDGVKLAPNKAYGSYTGSASLLITDKDGLLYYISGNDSSTMSRVTAYGSQIKTKPDSIVPLDSLFTDSTGKVWYVKSGSTLSIQATGTTGLNPNQVPGMPMLSSSRYFYTDSTGTLKKQIDNLRKSHQPRIGWPALQGCLCLRPVSTLPARMAESG